MPTHHHSLGVCLKAPIESAKKDTVKRLRIHYSTTPASAGIQWFDPTQTAGKVHPFCYTQCEAILARTLLPCQDVPAVKAPYSIAVTVPAPLVAACSGVPSKTSKYL
jgi:leukotriene-A4 hydrolase